MKSRAVSEACERKLDFQKVSYSTLNAKLCSGCYVIAVYSETAIFLSKTPEKLA